jgi:hypothetical protein
MRRRIGEQAERRTRIFGMRESKESGDDVNVRVERDVRCHQPLRPAVERDHGERDQ